MTIVRPLVGLRDLRRQVDRSAGQIDVPPLQLQQFAPPHAVSSAAMISRCIQGFAAASSRRSSPALTRLPSSLTASGSSRRWPLVRFHALGAAGCRHRTTAARR